MKKAFLIALAILTLLIATSCGTTNDVDNDVDTSSKQIKETNPTTIKYDLTETETFKDISFKYDDSWIKTTDTENISFEIDEPFVLIDATYFEYDSDTVVDPSGLFEIYKEPSDNERVIDSENFYINGSEPAVRIKFAIESNLTGESYREIIVFNYNSAIYSIRVYSDMDYKDDCCNLLSDIFETIIFE